METPEIEQAPAWIGLEFNEQIDVAIRPRFATRHGAEERELPDLPALAQRGQSVLAGHGDGRHGLHYTTVPGSCAARLIARACTSILPTEPPPCRPAQPPTSRWASCSVAGSRPRSSSRSTRR